MPTYAHYSVAHDCLAHGLHTLVEKPLTTDALTARHLVETAHRHQVALAVGHVERFNPAVQELKRRLRDGDVGLASALFARRTGPMPRCTRDTDVVLDLALHDIDIGRFLLVQMPTVIAAQADRAEPARPLDNTTIVLQFGGVRCTLEASWRSAVRVRTLQVIGTAGCANLDYLSRRLEIYPGGPDQLCGSPLHRPIDRLGPAETLSGEAAPESLYLQLEAFVEAALGRSAVQCDGMEGVKALTIVQQVRQLLAGS